MYVYTSETNCKNLFVYFLLLVEIKNIELTYCLHYVIVFVPAFPIGLFVGAVGTRGCRRPPCCLYWRQLTAV